MTDFEIASLTTQYIIGAGQVGIVYYGISRMMQASDQRTIAGERQEREAERRHAETMASLNDHGQALQAMIRGLDRQGQALATLIARTGSSGTA